MRNHPPLPRERIKAQLEDIKNRLQKYEEIYTQLEGCLIVKVMRVNSRKRVMVMTKFWKTNSRGKLSTSKLERKLNLMVNHPQSVCQSLVVVKIGPHSGIGSNH